LLTLFAQYAKKGLRNGSATRVRPSVCLSHRSPAAAAAAAACGAETYVAERHASSRYRSIAGAAVT